MRFDKHNAAALELLRKARPIAVEPTLFSFQKKTLVAILLAGMLVLVLITH